MTKRKHKATIGPVSEGTHRDEDLIPKFLNEIDYITPARITQLRKDPAWKAITNSLKNGNSLPETLSFVDSDGIPVIIGISEWGDYTAELFDILRDLAPPYCSFGSSEGDGASFGFWPDVDSARESVDFVSSKDQEDPPKGYRGEWLYINDHGNVTLYYRNSKGKDSEIWGVV